MYGTAGGLMVGGVNVCFPTILPGNIGQIIKDQIISTSTEQVLEVLQQGKAHKKTIGHGKCNRCRINRLCLSE